MKAGLPALAGCLVLTGCVAVPLTHQSHENLIEHQIERIDDIGPISTLRKGDTDPVVVRQTSSRTLMSPGQAPGRPTVRPAVGRSPAAAPEAGRPPAGRPSAAASKWLRNPLPDKMPDTPDWDAIVQAIGPSGKSAARKTVDVAGRTYSRGRGLVTGAARYATSRLGYSAAAAPQGEYMVVARPGQVGRGGLCWPVIGKVSRGFLPERNHKGIDICAPTGTPIQAARGGRVVYSGARLSGFGNVVILDHGNNICSVYAHNSRNMVADGQTVRQGQIIALVGQTGDASTPHCHFEIRHNTQPIDPRPFLP